MKVIDLGAILRDAMSSDDKDCDCPSCTVEPKRIIEEIDRRVGVIHKRRSIRLGPNSKRDTLGR